MESIVKSTILDPSLLCKAQFWDGTSNLQKIFREICVPEGLKKMKNLEFQEFYCARVPMRNLLGIEQVITRSIEIFKSFSWEENLRRIPNQFIEGFESLRSGLQKSPYIAHSVQNILLDEYVFLTSQSSMLSRMKKPFKIFERFRAIPLLNLEEIVPEEWRETVKGIKKAGDVINWVASIVGFAIGVNITLGGFIVKGIRLLLIDPSQQKKELDVIHC